MRIVAPAKINLYLRVFPMGADGFHPLRSWFRTIDLADTLDVTTLDESPNPPDYGWDWIISLRVHRPGLPSDGRNLIVRAWGECCEASGDGEPVHARIDLDKQIPLGGGLGGGSSDAAASLVACNDVRRRLGFAVLDHDALQRVAAYLGSDVPFFLHHQLDGITDATCTGRGEVVAPFVPGRRHAALLLLPDLSIPTPAVYRQFDAMPEPADDGEPDFAAWSRLAAMDLLPLLRNDLEAPAFALHPQLAALRERAEAALGRPVRMSGSGSTLFTLYDDAAEARDAALDWGGVVGLRRVVA